MGKCKDQVIIKTSKQEDQLHSYWPLLHQDANFTVVLAY